MLRSLKWTAKPLTPQSVSPQNRENPFFLTIAHMRETEKDSEDTEALFISGVHIYSLLVLCACGHVMCKMREE